MHKLPYENLVKVMMLHRDDPVEIVINLKELDFMLPSNITDLCREIYLKLKTDQPDYFANPVRYPDPDENYLKDQNLYGLYTSYYDVPIIPEESHYQNGYSGARKILEDPRMRRAIQAMALGGIKDEDIELLLNARYDLNYSPDDILFYLSHFFNIDGWRLPQIKALVEQETNEEFKVAYAIALKGDKGYLMWKLGLNPNKSYQEMLQDMMTDAFYLFKENARPGKNPELAQKWSTLALRVAEKLERGEKEDNDARDLFQSFEFNIQAPDAPKTVLRAEDLGEDLPEFQQESVEMEIGSAKPENLQKGTEKIKGASAKKIKED